MFNRYYTLQLYIKPALIKSTFCHDIPLFGLSKNPGVDKGPQPLMFNPALTTQGELPRRGKRRPPGGCASERMKTQRFSYFADLAARERMREAKPVKLKKSGVQPLF